MYMLPLSLTPTTCSRSISRHVNCCNQTTKLVVSLGNFITHSQAYSLMNIVRLAMARAGHVQLTTFTPDPLIE